jgi:hypothetical protein
MSKFGTFPKMMQEQIREIQKREKDIAEHKTVDLIYQPQKIRRWQTILTKLVAAEAALLKEAHERKEKKEKEKKNESSSSSQKTLEDKKATANTNSKPAKNSMLANYLECFGESSEDVNQRTPALKDYFSLQPVVSTQAKDMLVQGKSQKEVDDFVQRFSDVRHLGEKLREDGRAEMFLGMLGEMASGKMAGGFNF